MKAWGVGIGRVMIDFLNARKCAELLPATILDFFLFGGMVKVMVKGLCWMNNGVTNREDRLCKVKRVGYIDRIREIRGVFLLI